MLVPNSTILHSDSASVYVSGTIKKLLSHHGIISTASSPYHLTANSIAERGWRSVFDLARTMLSEAAKLSNFIDNSFWPEAIKHATLVMNLTALGHGSNNKSAYETILNKSPITILTKLLPFGTQAIIKIETGRSKLEPKGTPVIVLGYSLATQSYSIFNPITSRFSSSVNIQPNLSMFFDKSIEHPIKIQLGLESEIPIISSADIQELPAAMVPPEQIKQCDLLDDFDDFLSANPSANSSPIPQEAFSTVGL